MRVIGISNKGLKKEVNEDCYLIDNNLLYNINCDYDNASIAFVCDGVSNSKNAYNASYFICKEICESYEKLLSTKKTNMASYIDKINAKLVKEYEDGHTTLAGIVIKKDKIDIVNIGDSKVYTLKKAKLDKVSVDDTYYEFLKSKGDLNYHKYKNSHIITACLGNKMGIKKEIHHTQINNDFSKGECIVICSDGISDMIEKSKLEYFLSMDESLEVRVDKIEKRVLFKGARDNYTLIVIEF